MRNGRPPQEPGIIISSRPYEGSPSAGTSPVGSPQGTPSAPEFPEILSLHAPPGPPRPPKAPLGSGCSQPHTAPQRPHPGTNPARSRVSCSSDTHRQNLLVFPAPRHQVPSRNCLALPVSRPAPVRRARGAAGSRHCWQLHASHGAPRGRCSQGFTSPISLYSGASFGVHHAQVIQASGGGDDTFKAGRESHLLSGLVTQPLLIWDKETDDC